MTTKIPFFRHSLGQAELDAVGEVLKGPILTTGDTVAEFESRFASFLNADYAIGTTSCTGALHMSLLALGIGSDDEVITTPMTFIATATAIISAGARPVFVDVESDTGNLDVSQVESAITKNTKAIIPVHLYGQMCDMHTLRSIADHHKLHIIEDAAHCIEGARDGIKPGQLGDTACFSFYATKNLTCGEGGAVITNDPEVADRLRLLRSHGMTKIAIDRERDGYSHWDMVLFGWKYNMDNIHAALLLPQLEGIDERWNNRIAVADRYTHALEELEDVTLPSVVGNSKHAFHLYPIRVKKTLRDQLIKSFHRNGIGSTVNYRAIHLLSYFSETLGHSLGDFPQAEQIGDTTISLPFYPSIHDSHVDTVIETLKSEFGKFSG